MVGIAHPHRQALWGFLALFLSGAMVHGAKAEFNHYRKMLRGYACADGVNYAGLKRDGPIDSALQDFQWNEKTYAAATEAERLAYLINLYNVFTLKLVVEHYPVASIRDIQGPWEQPIIPYFGKRISLDHLENKVLRKEFQEPLIHFALNCASRSCPPLKTEPYFGAKLSQQLQAAAAAFLADTTHNRLQGDTLKISKIFEWYGVDFEGRYGGYRDFIIRQLSAKRKKDKLGSGFTWAYLPYDWKLNDQPRCKTP